MFIHCLLMSLKTSLGMQITAVKNKKNKKKPWIYINSQINVCNDTVGLDVLSLDHFHLSLNVDPQPQNIYNSGLQACVKCSTMLIGHASDVRVYVCVFVWQLRQQERDRRCRQANCLKCRAVKAEGMLQLILAIWSLSVWLTAIASSRNTRGCRTHIESYTFLHFWSVNNWDVIQQHQ